MITSLHSFFPVVLGACALLLCAPKSAAAQYNMTVQKIGPCELVQSDSGINVGVGGWVRGLCDGAEITAINGATPREKATHYQVDATETAAASANGTPQIRETIIGQAAGFTPMMTITLLGGEKIVLASYRDLPCDGNRAVMQMRYGSIPVGKLSIKGFDSPAVLRHFEGAACVPQIKR